jgi:hypothetical protein
MHGKEAAIAPVLNETAVVAVLVPGGIDTDRFSTFTRERCAKWHNRSDSDGQGSAVMPQVSKSGLRAKAGAFRSPCLSLATSAVVGLST